MKGGGGRDEQVIAAPKAGGAPDREVVELHKAAHLAGGAAAIAATVGGPIAGAIGGATIDDDQLEVRVAQLQVVALAGGKVVEDCDLVPEFQKAFGEVASDEPRSTRH